MVHSHSRHDISEAVAIPPSDILEYLIVTPEATVQDGSAELIALPLFDGEIGIAPLHCNMIGRLGYGEMRVMEGGKTDRYYVDGGFVQVLNNIVYILTNRAIPAQKVDAAAAQQLLDEARAKPATTPELLAIRDRAEAQARAQLRVAQHASGGSATGGSATGGQSQH